VKKEDVKVSVADGVLIVTGGRKFEKEGSVMLNGPVPS
jgi:HSP20 family molecular chaperone IbpA